MILMTSSLQPATHVATVNGRDWPASLRDDGMLIDLRLFEPDGVTLGYKPGELARAGIPREWVEAAAESVPAGFVLVPQSRLRTVSG